jgi:hypothetical protein
LDEEPHEMTEEEKLDKDKAAKEEFKKVFKYWRNYKVN